MRLGDGGPIKRNGLFRSASSPRWKRWPVLRQFWKNRRLVGLQCTHIDRVKSCSLLRKLEVEGWELVRSPCGAPRGLSQVSMDHLVVQELRSYNPA